MDSGNRYNSSFMDGSMKVNAEEIQAMAKRYKELADKASTILNSLNSTIDEMKQNWKGKSSDTFVSNYDGWKSNGRRYVNEIDRIADELKNASERFREADRR
ncbi:WXG100 family type VII secretion target [Clostridium acetobutylicum]|uniref:ESAT-6-like protein n=1 Tax=Clostridium acetobutylicum (strain ATCC 824 / DSM 792 / JCM 1419 / IAM 19013 / LMG 5710 / NBRC 13948 / NRRL B-527 / VKM B-1787 / 2291 / W) TaxID=272562 RepID=Q97LY7_CLOAB|nr:MULTISPECIES: WXG100 family type VII secretion target [Clostridium]AAK78393.1 Uncharacterized small conserved protein, homolog of YUKE/YFJA [Clostridium acetobutylicum ATCC 824]ADZ19462.1 Conserved hypothetical protein [Clostridium acetobutylicum EA 2018]AEI31229.1 hypothetical protein SMB_G0421 [Clostridium acetobutylicum DSM 1731]AWV80116.1 WXG100 family type VII secretion target [Clostridium acetobutylicum]MBC2392295.1 WXG100 family type VII secretion target [Clostridium acetobutylicum]